MKPISFRLGAILFIIGLFIFGYAEVGGADWVFLAAESDGTLWWFDSQGVTVHPNKVIRLWVKKVKDKEILEMIKSEGKIKPFELEKKVSERAYERSLMEIDCIKKTFNNLQIFNYGSEGVLKSAVAESNIKSIPPESVVETIYKTICK
jgi:hypothetical protein